MHWLCNLILENKIFVEKHYWLSHYSLTCPLDTFSENEWLVNTFQVKLILNMPLVRFYSALFACTDGQKKYRSLLYRIYINKQ